MVREVVGGEAAAAAGGGEGYPSTDDVGSAGYSELQKQHFVPLNNN